MTNRFVVILFDSIQLIVNKLIEFYELFMKITLFH